MGHGGQILLSSATRELVEDDLPAGVSLRDLGLHRLKDIDHPLRLYQAVGAGLQGRFPAPRGLADKRRRLLHDRRPRIVLVAVALMGTAAAAVVYVSGSASAKQVRLIANSIAVIDAKSGKPVGDVPLGFSPTDVAASGDQIWVLNGPGRTVVAIDPRRLRIVQTVGVDGDPGGQYSSGGRDWVAVSGGVDEIDTDGNTKVTLWPRSLLRSGQVYTGAACLAFVTGDGRSAWVSEGRHVAVLDEVSGSVLRTFSLPAPTGGLSSINNICYGVRYVDGELVAIREPDLSFGPVDATSGSYTPIATGLSTINAETPGGLSNWGTGFDSFWLITTTVSPKTLQNEDFLTRFDLVSGQIASRTALGAGSGALTIDPATGVWVVEPLQYTLAKVNPSGQIERTIGLRHAVGGVSAGHGRIWVALGSP